METYPKDAGANSLLHASSVAPVDAPTIQSMGLEYVPGYEGMTVRQSVPFDEVHGAYGALEPTFKGKGSPCDLISSIGEPVSFNFSPSVAIILNNR